MSRPPAKPRCRGKGCRRVAPDQRDLCAKCELELERAPGSFRFKGDNTARLQDPETGEFVTRLDQIVVDATGAEVSVTEMIARALKAGAPMRYAAAYAGVSSSAFFRWLREGRQAGASLELRRFVVEIDKAIAEVVVAGVARISSSDDWRAHSWMLEHRFPQDFGPVTRVDVGNADGQPFRTEQTQRLDLSGLSLEQKKQMLALLEQAGAGSDVIEAGEVVELDERRQIAESSG